MRTQFALNSNVMDITMKIKIYRGTITFSPDGMSTVIQTIKRLIIFLKLAPMMANLQISYPRFMIVPKFLRLIFHKMMNFLLTHMVEKNLMNEINL